MRQPNRPRVARGRVAVVGLGLLYVVGIEAAAAQDTLSITLAEAVRLAVEQSPALQAVRLEAREAALRVDEVRGELRPQLNATASYTREFASPNPFAGTDALGLFGQGAPTQWLLYNERARMDGDPSTRPITLEEFRERQEDAFRDAGVEPGGMRANPFAVENQFMAGLSLEHAIWSPAARAELRAAEAEREAVLAGAWQEALSVADSVRQAYLGALLAAEQAAVLARSVARAEADAAEAARRVEEGVAPVPERLSAEVERDNLRTDLIEARTQAAAALDRLQFVLDLPLDAPVVLTESLPPDDGYAAAQWTLAAAVAEAAERRRDVRQARLSVAAQRERARAARARLRPSITAFADLNVMGNVPDDRTRVQTDPLQPFQVGEERRGFFSGDFWGVGASAGVRLGWTLYGGGRLQVQERIADAAVEMAELQLRQVRSRVALEVRQALREVNAAAERALIQEGNVERAERNYAMVAERVMQGVAVPIERREASEQLDRSRLALAQARHDYRVARSWLRAAMGAGVEDALLQEWLYEEARP